MDKSILQMTPHPKVFPYLATRIVPALYHIILLPDFEEHALLQMANHQAQSNGLPACLVLGENRCVYITGDKINKSQDIPIGGYVIMGKLQPNFNEQEYIQKFPDYAQRHKLLAEFVDSHRGEGFMFGDLTKGGQDATEEEKIKLAGFNGQGVPTGLTKCTICGDWKGKCLDPNKEFEGKIIAVNCKCENYNRCAKCHGLLYKLKLNANHFDPQDNQIWHAPGFSGLSHKCEIANDMIPSQKSDIIEV